MKPNDQKRPYTKPELTEFGSVRNLTGGSGITGMDGMIGRSMLGGMGMGMGMGMSDLRLKENIREVGRHPEGFGLYLFDYKAEFSDLCEGLNRLGVIADEVLKVRPDAVVEHASGYLAVDYAKLGITPS